VSGQHDLAVYEAKLKLAERLRHEIMNSAKSTFFVIATSSEAFLASATLLDLASSRYIEAGILDAKKMSRDVAYKLSFELNARSPFPCTIPEKYSTALVHEAAAVDDSIKFIRSMIGA
jgi:hypothetical protein